MKQWMRRWFPLVWPDRTLRQRVAGEYEALGASKLLLADIAMRNFLFEASPDAADLYAAGVIEGRRRAALEIFQMTRVHPTDIANVLVAPAKRGDDHAA